MYCGLLANLFSELGERAFGSEQVGVEIEDIDEDGFVDGVASFVLVGFVERE